MKKDNLKRKTSPFVTLSFLFVEILSLNSISQLVKVAESKQTILWFS